MHYLPQVIFSCYFFVFALIIFATIKNVWAFLTKKHSKTFINSMLFLLHCDSDQLASQGNNQDISIEHISILVWDLL